MDYCLIDPDGRGVYCAVDSHGETVIRAIKDKVRYSANAKDDDFLRVTVARNVPSLLACKQVLMKATGARDEGGRHSTANRFPDVMPVAGIVQEKRIFDHIPSWVVEDVEEAIDPVAREPEALPGPAILEYRRGARVNWRRVDGIGVEVPDRDEVDDDALDGHPGMNFDEGEDEG